MLKIDILTIADTWKEFISTSTLQPWDYIKFWTYKLQFLSEWGDGSGRVLLRGFGTTLAVIRCKVLWFGSWLHRLMVSPESAATAPEFGVGPFFPPCFRAAVNFVSCHKWEQDTSRSGIFRLSRWIVQCWGRWALAMTPVPPSRSSNICRWKGGVCVVKYGSERPVFSWVTLSAWLLVPMVTVGPSWRCRSLGESLWSDMRLQQQEAHTRIFPRHRASTNNLTNRSIYKVNKYASTLPGSSLFTLAL